MQLFVQQVVEGIASGAIYASLALAMVLIYRATNVVNFAQGEMGTFSCYLLWQMTLWGVPLWLAFLATGVLSFLIGILVYRLIMYPAQPSSDYTIVVICIGLFVGFEAMCLWIWGADSYAFPRIFPDTSWTLLGIRLTANNLGVLGVLVLMALAITALFRFTRIGLAMRAAAAERDKSPLVGIPVETMLMFGWGIATVVGFIAAALVAPRLFLSPPMMLPVVIYSLAAATLGGWTSPFGAIVGGLLVGVAESLAGTFVAFIGAELKIGVAFLVMAIVLLVRPQGLFGEGSVVRV